LDAYSQIITNSKVLGGTMKQKISRTNLITRVV